MMAAESVNETPVNFSTATGSVTPTAAGGL